MDQTILSERLTLSLPVAIVQDAPDERGERRFRAMLSGERRISDAAVVDNGLRQPLHASARQHPWSELPQHVLQYLTPSRYCPSEKFLLFARREFGAIAEEGERVMTVLDLIHAHVDYAPGVSNAETTAERTFVDRAGVCRDFSHLAITLCRARNMPARAVSACAWQLDPPDFHAVFGVFFDGRRRLAGPTRLSSGDGLARIGVGHDAADIAFLATTVGCPSISQAVTITQAASGLAARLAVAGLCAALDSLRETCMSTPFAM